MNDEQHEENQCFDRIVCDGCGKDMEYVGEKHEILYNIEDRFPELCGYGKEIKEGERR